MHSAGEFVPTSALVPLLPKLGYTIFFSTKTADAVQELDKDIRKSLRVPLGNPGRTNSPPEFLTSTETFMRPWDEIEVGVFFFSKLLKTDLPSVVGKDSFLHTGRGRLLG